MPAFQQADGTIVHIDPAEEMRASDSLPASIRSAMNDSLNPPPAVLVRQWMQQGASSAQVIAIISGADLACHRDLADRGEVAPHRGGFAVRPIRSRIRRPR